MVKLNSNRLHKSYLNYIALKNALIYVQQETYRRNDDGFLNAIGFPYIGELTKDRKKTVALKMDAMYQAIEELIVIGLVSDFEKIIFDRVDNASGEIVKIVKQKYDLKPFNDFSADFVKSSKDIDKLSIIKKIIDPKLPKELSDKFKDIIEFRNRLAHGKRFGEQLLLSFDEIAQILDDVLNFI
ncbi:MAG: HEPN domain-containing protein [Arcicella sp.]|nr:HEPN domain-containing protein [Arcicella sp.]